MGFVEGLLRWIHVVAGIIWIGHLYFFNFVNGPYEKTLDGDTKKKVVPELRPRALYWFRWGAMFTWVSGFLLLGMMYLSIRGKLTESIEPGRHMLSVVTVLVAWVVGFLVYDRLWTSGLAKDVRIGAAISFALLVGYMAILRLGLDFQPAALYINIGSLLGTLMFMNVWMRIWPNQRRIITAIKEGQAPDAGMVALALLRSRHNTYMSVPLVFCMLAQHQGALANLGATWLGLAGVVLVSWGVVYWLYRKSQSAAVTAL